MHPSLQLLCTFADCDYRKTIYDIKGTYYLIDKKVFVFENANNEKQIILSYNTEKNQNNKKLTNTISVHRNKEHNVMFTLNAINHIIREENNGILDKTYKIDWSIYKNCLIITSPSSYKTIDLKLIDMVKI
jgi:hypothetical protein